MWIPKGAAPTRGPVLIRGNKVYVFLQYFVLSFCSHPGASKNVNVSSLMQILPLFFDQF